MNRYDITFICPYFGKLPKDYFQLWLQSCAYNKTCTWIVITDDYFKYNYPSNVKVINMSFDKFRDKIQEKFDFKITLNNPYKLCDYRPLYGYIFEELLLESSFWGYCDISDCIFGNLKKFITADILEQYNKINFLGHMTIYKNDYNLNRLFNKIPLCGFSINDIICTDRNMAFDELLINTLFLRCNVSFIRLDDMYADISPLRYAFQLVKSDINYNFYKVPKIPTIFEWDKGTLLQISVKNKKIIKTELGYVHFQKRKMKNYLTKNNHYYIVPDGFVEIDNVNEKNISKYSKDKLFYTPFFC